MAPGRLTPHLKRLESEAIEVIRETAAEFQRPVLLYSIGKDSSVLLHLSLKAFFPGTLPFPLLHIDTTWKFKEMIKFRDQIAREKNLELRVHVNQEGIAKNVNPFNSDTSSYTNIMKTDALRQAIELYGFDGAIGGARRDEEKSRSKERFFSIRNHNHGWDPRAQRPELWRLFNPRLGPGETMRVFPLSNWTELDVWEYIHAEEISVVPLYFAADRPVLRRSGTLICVDDERLDLKDGERPERMRVRFRTLGCWPLTGAVESTASTVADVIAEMRTSQNSERHGRLIDSDNDSSMERKKRQGYF